jgi:hypothetical protein
MSCFCRQSITVTADSWRRTRDSENVMASLVRGAVAELGGIGAESRARLDRELAATADRGRRADQLIAGLSEGVRRQEESTQRRLAAMDADLRAAVDGLAATGAELTGAIQQVGRRLTAELADVRRSREVALAGVRDELGALTERSRGAAAAAGTALADCRRLVELIGAGGAHARFAPGELASLTGRLGSAERTAADGQSQAALAAATGLANALADLRLTVEVAELAWQLARMAAAEALRQLRSVLDGAARLAGPGDTDIDVDHWSGGALTALAGDAADLAAAVEADDPPLSAARLTEITATTVPDLRASLAGVIAAATAAQDASQLRINVADMAAGALAAQGFSVVGGVYAGDDDRNAFHAKVVHEDGTEVVAVVEADSADPNACVLRLESYDLGDAPGAEEIRRLRGVELAASLADSGLIVGVPSRDSGSPDPMLRDLERTRRPADARVRI